MYGMKLTIMEKYQLQGFPVFLLSPHRITPAAMVFAPLSASLTE
jgi:hypothetical protein